MAPAPWDPGHSIFATGGRREGIFPVFAHLPLRMRVLAASWPTERCSAFKYMTSKQALAAAEEEGLVMEMSFGSGPASSTGFKGVRYDVERGRYHAAVHLGRKSTFVGSAATKEGAAYARARYLHKGILATSSSRRLKGQRGAGRLAVRGLAPLVSVGDSEEDTVLMPTEEGTTTPALSEEGPTTPMLQGQEAMPVQGAVLLQGPVDELSTANCSQTWHTGSAGAER